MSELADHLATDVVSWQEVAGHLTAQLRSTDLLRDGVAKHWADTGWLVHDLEDWDLLELHHALARPLTAKSRGEHPYVAGVSLSQGGLTVVRLLGPWSRSRVPTFDSRPAEAAPPTLQ